MKKLLTTLLLFFVTLLSYSQKILSLESYDNASTARINAMQYYNGDVCYPENEDVFNVKEDMLAYGSEMRELTVKDDVSYMYDGELENQLFLNTKERSKFDFTCGPLIGVQMNSLVDKLVNIEWKPGITFGVFTRFAIKNFILQPEVLYHNSVFNFIIEDLGGEGKLTRSYLSIPLLCGYQTKGKTIKMRFAAGPVCQFLISQKVKTDDVSHKPNLKSGVGIAFNIGADWNRIVLDINYNWGLTSLKGNFDIIDDLGYYDGNDFVGLSELKQNVISLTVGYKLF